MNNVRAGLIASLFLLGAAVNAACPQADLSGDCRVNLKDFSILSQWWLIGCPPGGCDGADLDASGAVGVEDLTAMAGQWLDVGQPDLSEIVWVDIEDPGFVGQMSRYLITNAQYAAFLNSALLDEQIEVFQDQDDFVIVEGLQNHIYYEESYYSNASIGYDGLTETFFVRPREERDMSNHPVCNVSWYGASAFCDYYGYRLPTELEWKAVADYDGTYVYGCGVTIDSTLANYFRNNPLGFSDFPYTTPVDHYPAFGYGLNDMAGNVWQWTDTLYSGDNYITCGGSWFQPEEFSRIEILDNKDKEIQRKSADFISTDIGFRVCRNLPLQ